MKKIFAAVFISLTTVIWLHAQELQIYKSDGNAMTIPLPEIDSITFILAGTGGPGPCPGTPTVTDIDGNVYNTVFIGGQCWMKENLKTTRFRNGQAADYFWYDNDSSYKDKYGALYTKSSLLCPEGWHMPSGSEWGYLTSYVNGSGRALKSCRQVDSPLGGDCNTTEHPRWDPIDTHGLDTYGFSALPGGSKIWNISDFGGLGVTGVWWTTFSSNMFPSWVMYIFNNGDTNIDYVWGGPNYYSVRCVKD